MYDCITGAVVWFVIGFIIGACIFRKLHSAAVIEARQVQLEQEMREANSRPR